MRTILTVIAAVAMLSTSNMHAKCHDDETDLAYYGYRYYNATTGRWLSRDPIGEASVLRQQVRSQNRLYVRAALKASLAPSYVFIGNRPTVQIDVNGLFGYYLEGIEEMMYLLYGPKLITPDDWPVQIFPGKDGALKISVGKCSIAIITGHGASDRPHRFDFPNAGDCGDTSFGGFTGCDSADINNRIPSSSRIPGAPMHEGEVGRYSEEGIEGRKAIRNGALATARDLCGRNCCKRVAIVTYEAAKNDPLEDFFYHRAQPTLEYYDCKTQTVK